MTVIAVSILVSHVSEVPACLERAAAAVKNGANLIEWRLDPIANDADGVAAARQLLAGSPVPCIVTARSAAEGGLYDGDDIDRISFLEAIVAAGETRAEHQPRYIDVELATLERSANLRQKVLLAVNHPKQARDLQTSLIESVHGIAGRPVDLLQRIERMAADPACAVIKIAWHARSLRDNLEAFDLLRHRHKPTIALCMGPFGLMSRVLAPKFGGLLTFASDAPDAATAPGQPTIEELRRLYRFDRIDAETKVYGVIGWPVEHSLSPRVHNAGFETLGFNGVYLPLPVPGGPSAYEPFKATLGALLDHAELDFRGASVTLPHKENLIRFARERKAAGEAATIEPLAEAIGAANTLVVKDDRTLLVSNTDAPAAVDALCEGLKIEPAGLKGTRVAILGAGGVARAVAAGLALHGSACVVFNRSHAPGLGPAPAPAPGSVPGRAQRLADDLNAALPALARDFRRIEVGRPGDLGCGCFDVFINCTPLGMAGGPDPTANALETLHGDHVALDEAVTILDTVYAPQRTPLIAEAASRGCRVIPGMAMFLRQAARQFEMFTGRRMPETALALR